MVAEAVPEFRNLRQTAARMREKIEVAKKAASEQETQIDQLEREIVQHREPADQLNRELAAYLGHAELKLAVMETGYQVMRGDSIADGLSEGECSAIALLYFLKSLDDHRFDLSNGVVVLDDPVSSLDSNALFCAFGYIKERTKAAGELFVLTHNFTFFRQVRYWFQKLRGQGKGNIGDRPARFYMLDCSMQGGQRCSMIRWLDPLLERYQSEYHYLFSVVYGAAMGPPTQNLESWYFMPNVARRLLEAFLTFRIPDTKNMWEQLQRVKYDEAKKVRIFRFLNAYSHREQIDEQDHDLSVLSESQSVLKDLLNLMQVEDPSHFSAMVRLVGARDVAVEGSSEVERVET
jgi:wobble nucleotide-excising tRNase